jgi:hypothetical protein
VAKLYCDQNVDRDLANLLRGRGHDVVIAYDLTLARAKDDRHLLTAATEQRTLVTYNRDDFVLLHDAWRRWSAAWRVTSRHAGILVLPQPPKWPTPEAAPEVDRLLRSARALDNELYEWRRASGWARRS